ncbi:hypothetical protein ASAC_0820 [Acidilobus saccharovorans 345-15]|uniref:Thioredoxin n=1 Tax=Acidilobus saccharovorans (strain DSM 16705 / JCM 18335 / VKM B-2471 / 345-15) TaxID=666510 RepID=D9Q1N8_ACIS3|nr:hypothetical protein ASAC_0820 [Acidilobus saccharovorans 345-15]
MNRGGLRRRAVSSDVIPKAEGVYVYSKGKGWSKAGCLSPSSLSDGLNLIYFRNNWCASCAVLDLKMPDIVEMYYCRATIYVVSCTWFTTMCLDTMARRAFQQFKIKDSPTLYWAVVSQGRLLKELRMIGVPSLSELKKYVASNLGVRPCVPRARPK